MVTYVLIIIGAVFALIGIFLFVKGIGSKTASKVKFLGLEVETRSSSLIIFLVGAALIAFGATNNNSDSGNIESHKSVEYTTQEDDKILSTSTTTTNQSIAQPSNNNNAPFKEFTLTSGQQQVLNDLKVTFTLENQRWNAETNAVTIRIWRNISQPLSDTAYLDPSAGQPGVVNQLFRIDNITPVSIPDVGQFKIIVSQPIISNNQVASAQVTMFRN